MAWFLMFLAILGTALFHFAFDLPRHAVIGDTVVQQALDRSARAAAQQYVGASLAAGNPQVDPARADAQARAHLAGELRLDPVTLAPQAGSPLASTPSLTVFVYNGPAFPYTYNPRPDVRVTLPYPGVVLILDAEISPAARLSSGQTRLRISRYAAAVWMPRQRPSG